MSTPLQALLIGSAALFALSGCGPAGEQMAADQVEAPNPPAPDAHDMETLPVAFRVAFMSGHVEAGLALYRAGAPEQAAKHLLHPVSETHAAERAGIDALGFAPDVFERVSDMLEAGAPASEIEPLLQDAEANMARMQVEAAGDPAAIIAFLMDTAAEEYAIGVTDGAISDPGEYQDAFGFSIVALKIARRLEGADALVAELETLTALWPPSGPLADSDPQTVAEVTAQIDSVRAALAAL